MNRSDRCMTSQFRRIFWSIIIKKCNDQILRSVGKLCAECSGISLFLFLLFYFMINHNRLCCAAFAHCKSEDFPLFFQACKLFCIINAPSNDPLNGNLNYSYYCLWLFTYRNMWKWNDRLYDWWNASKRIMWIVQALEWPCHIEWFPHFRMHIFPMDIDHLLAEMKNERIRVKMSYICHKLDIGHRFQGRRKMINHIIIFLKWTHLYE